MVTYDDKHIHDLITQSLHELSFTGIKGFTEFDENGDPSAKIILLQQQGKIRSSLPFIIWFMCGL